MKKPKWRKPIKLAGRTYELELIGEPDHHLPYISMGSGHYIEDRDIKRLKKWCETCLKGRLALKIRGGK